MSTHRHVLVEAPPFISSNDTDSACNFWDELYGLSNQLLRRRAF